MNDLNTCYSKLPKLATIYGFVAAYVTTVNADGDNAYLCLHKNSMNASWGVVSLAAWEIASFYDHSRSDQAISEARQLHPDFTIVQLPLPICLESIDPQLRKATGHGYSGAWGSFNSTMGFTGFQNLKQKIIAIEHDDDLFRHQQHDIILDSSGLNIAGFYEDYEYSQQSTLKYGFISQELYDSKNIELALDIADEIRTWHNERHQRITVVNTVDEWNVERLKPENKSLNASRVLKMMDSTYGGDGRYCEFVNLIAEQAGITIAELDAELAPFI